MRLLWFSNKVPAGAIPSKKTVGGSWIESLEHQLTGRSDIDLGIVFTQLEKKAKKIKSLDSSTRYYMTPRYPHSKLGRWVNRFFVTAISEKPLKEYLKVVEEFKPDVILFFGTESDFPLIIPSLKVPSIIWFQGNLTVYERMYQTGIRLSKTVRFEKLKTILMGDTLLHNYWSFKQKVEREKHIFSIAENFIGRTDWDRRLVSTMSPQSKYYHCDEAMRDSFWNNEWKQNLHRDKFTVVTTIRGNPYKGLETIFETARILVGHLKIPLEWRVAGIKENTAYVRTSRYQAETNKSDLIVKLLGSKTELELLTELMNADVYVHPSHIENSPNGVQEAMLLGMPVIATNVGGTPSLLINDTEGLLVQNGDPFAMAGAILELYNSPERARVMGENARKRGLVRNDSEKICSDLLSIFDKMVNETNADLG